MELFLPSSAAAPGRVEADSGTKKAIALISSMAMLFADYNKDWDGYNKD